MLALVPYLPVLRVAGKRGAGDASGAQSAFATGLKIRAAACPALQMDAITLQGLAARVAARSLLSGCSNVQSGTVFP